MTRLGLAVIAAVCIPFWTGVALLLSKCNP